MLHVDHIIPKTRNPHLALCFDNLQILCEECNEGKSNKFNTDWRPMVSNEIKIYDYLDYQPRLPRTFPTRESPRARGKEVSWK